MKRFAFLPFLLMGSALLAQPKMEYLTRGLHVVPDGKGDALVSWRLLGTEDTTVNFNLYRTEGKSKVLLTPLPISIATSYLDKIDTTKEYVYTVKAVVAGK